MSRSQKIYETLITSLRSGAYQPGDRIRAEDVAKTFEVSRTPVREALSRLLERGLLEMTATGLAVTRLHRQSVLELYAMREILEGAAARFAAQHASPSDIYSMRRIADAFSVPSDDAPRVAHLNRELHDAITEAAHNRYLLSMLHGMHDAVMVLPSTTFATPGRQEAAVHEHAAILDAIEGRDPDEADRLAREHIRHARDARLAMMFDY